MVCDWSIPRDSNDNGVVTMLEELTKEVNDKPFVNILQQGGDEVIKNSTFCSRILMDM